jgi:hypothetical protein
MEILGYLFLMIGLTMTTIGGLWFLITCFMKSFWWVLACIFIPLAEIFFLFIHWKEASKPAATAVIGGLLIGAAMLILPTPMP